LLITVAVPDPFAAHEPLPDSNPALVNGACEANRVALCPPGLVTVTFTAPELWAGVTAVMVVLLTTVTLLAAVEPKVTVAPDWKLVPVSWIEVPPEIVPEFGEMEATVT
jgi:hypothetical protein